MRKFLSNSHFASNVFKVLCAVEMNMRSTLYCVMKHRLLLCLFVTCDTCVLVHKICFEVCSKTGVLT